jgi:hypothetical protein
MTSQQWLQKAFSATLQNAEFISLTKDAGWQFYFGEVSLRVESDQWRVFKGKLQFCASDDGQKFGLPKPFDVVTRTQELLSGQNIQAFQVREDCNDLILSFGNDVKLEILQSSGGYESWMMSNSQGPKAVATGDGELVVWLNNQDSGEPS